MRRAHHPTLLWGLIFGWKMTWTGGTIDSLENLLGGVDTLFFFP